MGELFNSLLGGEPADQDTERRILLRTIERHRPMRSEVDRGTRDSKRMLTRARDIATLSRRSGAVIRPSLGFAVSYRWVFSLGHSRTGQTVDLLQHSF
jgi:hypothetical protein